MYLGSNVYISAQFAREKACELEDYQCVSLSGTDLAGEEQPAVKKRKLVKQVGNKFISFCSVIGECCLFVYCQTVDMFSDAVFMSHGP